MHLKNSGKEKKHVRNLRVHWGSLRGILLPKLCFSYSFKKHILSSCIETSLLDEGIRSLHASYVSGETTHGATALWDTHLKGRPAGFHSLAMC